MLAAFAYVAGYVATNVLTELARRTDDPSFRREALRFSTRFENLALLLIIVLMVLRPS